MKKILIFAVVLSLLVPAAAFAATEFSLGGYIKLDTLWDSGQNVIAGYLAPERENNSVLGTYHHGWFGMTAEGTRFNFTIKGPDVLGAKLTGFIEMDFEATASTAPIVNTSFTASNSFTPRLRHAMFRLNWPGDTELIMGQYWSLLCDYYAEATEDAPLQLTGCPIFRVPQIRLSQGFLGDWTVSGLIAEPTGSSATPGNIFPIGFTANTTEGGNAPGNALQLSNNGQTAETPQVEVQLKYAHNWWGMAPYYGVPKPFTAEVTAAWQRNVVAAQGTGGLLNLAGQPSWPTGQVSHGYISPWIVQGSLFIPVIPANGPNLAGSAHFLVSPWIGQNPTSFGFTQVNESAVFHAVGTHFIESPFQHFGGFLEGQYYFTNQWFINAAAGLRAIYNYNQRAWIGAAAAELEPRVIRQVDATLWWRPVSALKFGLEYTYNQAKYLVNLDNNGALAAPGGHHPGDLGDEHRVEFVGYFFF